MSRRNIVFALAIIIIALVACGESATSTNTSTSTPVTQAAQPTSAPTHALKWTTTHTFSGNGTKKTAVFSVPDDWKILYSCTYQNIGGITADGVLVVTVYASDNSLLDLAVNATCKTSVAKTTGETEEHQSGQVYLSVDGIGDWSIQVQEMK